MILDQCKGVHCVDLGKSFQTHIYLQNFVSIQPRTNFRAGVRTFAPEPATALAAQSGCGPAPPGGALVLIHGVGWEVRNRLAE